MNLPMTDAEAAEKIRLIDRLHDTARNHEDADRVLLDILRQCGFLKTAKAFQDMDKWYS